MKYYDQHVHNYYSKDSKETIENYILAARELGINYLIFTNHIDLEYGDNKNEYFFDIDKEHDYIEKIAKENPDICFLKGVEIGFSKNRLKDLNDICNRTDFDLINLSMHYEDGIDFYQLNEYETKGIDFCLNVYCSALKNMLSSLKNYDVFCHLGYGFRNAYLLDPNFDISKYELEIKEILQLVINDDKTLEINTKVQERINNDNHLRWVLRLYKSLGGKNLTLSSDAHNVDRYCHGFDKYTKIIKEEGFNHLCYFIKRKRYLYYI